MTRTDILNLIAAKIKAHSYLEIGVADKNLNFNHINCPVRLCVDPDPGAKADLLMTSDQFFREHGLIKWDLVFIDGLHHWQQVSRDIENSLNVLSEGGVLVLHDCFPHREEIQRVPRETLEWTGDVWKAFVTKRMWSNLQMFTVDVDYGCGVILRGKQTPIHLYSSDDLTWENFQCNRKEWLNLITPQEFLEKLDTLCA